MISPEARLHIVQRADNRRGGQRSNAISQDMYVIPASLIAAFTSILIDDPVLLQLRTLPHFTFEQSYEGPDHKR